MSLYSSRLRILPVLMPLLVALVFASAPLASARRSLPQAITISGSIVNSSHGDAPVSSQTVQLVETASGQSATVARATTDAKGAFSITNFSPDPNASFELEVQYQGGAFTSASYDSTQLGAQPVTLHVFDTSFDDATVLVALTTLVLDAPNVQAGTISVAESITVYNTGLKAYVATIEPVAGKPMNLLRFALPTGARNLVLGAGFATVQVIQAPSGFGVTATIPPGSTEFAFAYDLPYSAATLAITAKAAYTSRQVVALVPSNLHLTAGDFTQKTNVTAAGSEFQLLEQDNVAASKTLRFTLRDLPRPGQPQYLDVRALGVVGFLLALLLLAALFVYLRWGSLAPLLFGADRRRPATYAVGDPRDAERRMLLRQHLALDEQRKAGKLTAANYERQRSELRDRLRALIAAQQTRRDALHGQRASSQTISRAITSTGGNQALSAAPQPKIPATPGGES